MVRSAWLGAVSTLALLAPPAFAQDTSTASASQQTEEVSRSTLADIVVTAQRRRESVQSVPIAITALDSKALETRGVSSALDVAQFVPNLVGLNNTGLGTANAYYLRGIGNTESIATFDPPIGTYVDDVYLSRQNANNLSFFDVERVEVLRGPQGTLFGRNTTGGAINVIMREPGNAIGGYVEGGYGSYNRYHGRASIDVPLAPTFAIKVSGFYQHDDGWAINSVTKQRTNQNNGWGVRVGARGELAENVRWTGSFTHTYADAANLLNFDCDPANPANCNGRFVSTGLTRPSSFGGLIVGPKNNFGLGNKAWFNLVTSNFQIGGDDLRLNLITGFVDLRQQYALDFADGRGLPSLVNPNPAQRNYTLGGFTIANDGKHTQFTQEAKLTARVGTMLDLVAGIYYYTERNNTDFADIFNLGGPGPTGFPFVLADRRLVNTADALAGYAQGDVHITPALTLTAGIRYTDEIKKFHIEDQRAACQAPVPGANCLFDRFLTAGNGVPIPTRQETKVWTPRFALNYKASNELLLFISATRGFKSGGWNARGTTPSELFPFGPEKAWSYEAGFKSDLLDRRLRVNGTAFQLDVTDLQTPSAFIRTNGTAAFITRNFANYRNRGLELEIQALPVNGLNLFASFGYSSDTYRLNANAPAFDAYGVQSVAAQLATCATQLAAKKTPVGSGADNATACGVGIVTVDGKLAKAVRSPPWTVALGFSYEMPLSGGLTLQPAANANWRAKSETGTSNVSLYSQGFTSAGGVTYAANPFGNGALLNGSLSPARWIVNASLALKSQAGWSVTAECKNCFDKISVESSLVNYTYFNAPRSFDLRAKFNF